MHPPRHSPHQNRLLARCPTTSPIRCRRIWTGSAPRKRYRGRRHAAAARLHPGWRPVPASAVPGSALTFPPARPRHRIPHPGGPSPCLAPCPQSPRAWRGLQVGRTVAAKPRRHSRHDAIAQRPGMAHRGRDVQDDQQQEYARASEVQTRQRALLLHALADRRGSLEPQKGIEAP